MMRNMELNNATPSFMRLTQFSHAQGRVRYVIGKVDTVQANSVKMAVTGEEIPADILIVGRKPFAFSFHDACVATRMACEYWSISDIMLRHYLKAKSADWQLMLSENEASGEVWQIYQAGHCPFTTVSTLGFKETSAVCCAGPREVEADDLTGPIHLQHVMHCPVTATINIAMPFARHSLQDCSFREICAAASCRCNRSSLLASKHDDC